MTLNLPAALAAALLVLIPATPVPAQVVPATPRHLDSRNTGEKSTQRGIDIGPGNIGGGVGATIPKDQTTITTVSYIALGPDRQWTSSDGKTMTAKIIAWQDSTRQVVREGKPGDPSVRDETAESAPIPPTFVPQVVKDDRIRILRDKKVYELPLDRLSEADQTHVRQLQQVVQADAARRAEARSPQAPKASD